MTSITEDKSIKATMDDKKLYTGINKQKNSTVTFEQTEQRAYHLWLEKGGRHGKDLEDWLQAEKELEAEESLLEE